MKTEVLIIVLIIVGVFAGFSICEKQLLTGADGTPLSTYEDCSPNLTLPSKQKQIILLAFDRDWAKDENNLNKYDELDRKEYGEHEENEIEISEVEN